MTLFTSVKRLPKQNRTLVKTAIAYLMMAIFCFVFQQVYNLFGHGVTSAALSLIFLYPLLAGVLPFFLLSLLLPQAGKLANARFSFNCYHSGIATLTVGSLLQGIFEIAGTGSPYTVLFLLIGSLFVLIGLVGFAIALRRHSLIA